MFGTIRKHQTWLWAIIITLTIISFVVFFSPYSKMDSAQRGSANLGSIYGQKITEAELVSAQRDAILHYFFMSGGNWPDQDSRRMGFDVERETYQWLMLRRKAEQLGLHVSREAAAEVGREMLNGFKRQGVANAAAFFKQVLEPRGISAEDFERFVREYVAIQQIVATAGLAGRLITPQEARALYIRDNQELATEAVFFNGSNYLASVTLSPEAIAAYYTNSLSQYRIPERIQVKYVAFGISNLLPKAEAELAKTNLADIVNANFERLGTNYLRFGDTPEAAKAKIREELVRGKALSEARNQAGSFARELFDQVPVKSENLEALAKAKSLEVKVSSAFDRQGSPAELEVGAEFARAAFSRTADEPFSTPIVGRDAVYVLAVDRRLTSEVPALADIRDKVVADYKINEATKLARAAGQAFSQTLSNGLAQGKSFADVCREANVKPVTLPPLSLSTRSLPQLPDDVSLEQVKQHALGTEPGKASPFEFTRYGGMVLYVGSKLPIDEAKLNAELSNYVAQQRMSRQNEAFNEWFRKESVAGLRDTPLGQPKAPPPMSGAPPSKS